MSVTSTVKLNNLREKIYYIRFSRVLSASALTPLSQLFGGLLQSFTSKDAQGNETALECTYKEINEIMGIPEPSICRAVREYKRQKLVRKNGASAYVFEHDKVQGRKWSCPLEVMYREFDMTDDDGNTFKKKLTPATVLVYAYVYTKKTGVDAPNKEIADELGLHPDTVADALTYLRWAKLIYYPKANVGVNGYKKNRIRLNTRWKWFKQEKEYRGRLRAPETPEETDITTRELYYSRLQTKAQKKAEKAKNKALKNIDYNAIIAEISRVRTLGFRACTPQQQQAFETQINALYAERDGILKNIGLSAEQLAPDYYAKCTCCNDTGYKPDGTACDCYERHRRGSPPKGKRTTKGIE